LLEVRKMAKSFMVILVLFLATVAVFAQEPVARDVHAEHMSSAPAAQDWAKQRLEKSPRHQEWGLVKNGQRNVNSFIVYPEVKNKATAVVVMRAIFGLTGWARSGEDAPGDARE